MRNTYFGVLSEVCSGKSLGSYECVFSVVNIIESVVNKAMLQTTYFFFQHAYILRMS